MKTLLEKPSETVSQDADQYLIFVQIKIQALPASLFPPGIHMPWPDDNTTATLILSEALEKAMRLENLNVTIGGAAGDLNDSLYLFKVNRAVPALESIIQTLERVNLSDMATIWWLYPGETHFRCRKLGLFDNAKTQFNLEQVQAQVAAARAKMTLSSDFFRRLADYAK